MGELRAADHRALLGGVVEPWLGGVVEPWLGGVVEAWLHSSQ